MSHWSMSTVRSVVARCQTVDRAPRLTRCTRPRFNVDVIENLALISLVAAGDAGVSDYFKKHNHRIP